MIGFLRKGVKYSLLSSGIIGSCIFASQSFAYTFPFSFPDMEATPVINIGGGVAIASDVGKSQTIPIHDPVTDEFFHYSANRKTQTAGLFNVFVGAEVKPCCSDIFFQTGLDYSQTSHYTARGRVTQGADILSADTFRYHYRVINRQLLVEGKLFYTLPACFYPYLLAGVGVAFNEAYHFHANVPTALTFTRQYESETHTTFSYAVGFGVDADVAPHVRFGINYRFTDFGRVKLGRAVIDTTPVRETLKQSNIYSNEVLAQFTFVL